MVMCDAIVRSARMENLQSSAEMIEQCNQHVNSLDCRPAFIEAASNTVWLANEGFGAFQLADEAVTAPFLHWSKEDIAYRALQLGVPLHLTWSCYKGGENHCGRCGTCVERLEAIDTAVRHIGDLSTDVYEGVAKLNNKKPGERWDQTVYDDEEFWKQAVKEKP